MDFAAHLTQLNIRLGDTDNFTFTSDEKTSCLTEAFNDNLVVTEIWDSTLTFDVSTYQYAKPSGVSTVQDIYIRPGNSNDTEPERISSNLWEVVGANIQFKNNANGIIPDGYTLYVKGKTKATTASTISDVNLQEFILNLAQLNCLNMLGVKKALKFLKNDVSMSEIIAMKRELERKVGEYRRRLPRQFESA